MLQQIDFFRITNAYPRILISKLNFEAIMHLFCDFSKFLAKTGNFELECRLSQPPHNYNKCEYKKAVEMRAE